MLDGITAGFILSLTLFPGTVWLTKVGVKGTKAQVFAVAFGFWVSHLFWLLIAVPGLMMMTAHLPFIKFGMHLFGAFVLLYLSFKFARSPRVARIDDAPDLPDSLALYRSSMTQSLAMPMRLPAAMAILLSTGVYHHNTPEWSIVSSIVLGVLIGLTWWWGQFSFLAAFFAKRVSYPVTIKSLNKIRPFCSVLCLCLSGITFFLGF